MNFLSDPDAQGTALTASAAKERGLASSLPATPDGRSAALRGPQELAMDMDSLGTEIAFSSESQTASVSLSQLSVMDKHEGSSSASKHPPPRSIPLPGTRLQGLRGRRDRGASPGRPAASFSGQGSTVPSSAALPDDRRQLHDTIATVTSSGFPRSGPGFGTSPCWHGLRQGDRWL